MAVRTKRLSQLMLECENVCRCKRLRVYINENINKLNLDSLETYMKRIFYVHCDSRETASIINLFMDNKFDVDDFTVERMLALFQIHVFDEIFDAGTFLNKLKLNYKFNFTYFLKYLCSASNGIGCLAKPTVDFFVEECEGDVNLIKLLFGKFFNGYFIRRSSYVDVYLCPGYCLDDGKVCFEEDFQEEIDTVNIFELNVTHIWNDREMFLGKYFARRMGFTESELMEIVKGNDICYTLYALDYMSMPTEKNVEDIALRINEGILLEVLKFKTNITSKCFENICSKGACYYLSRLIDHIVDYGYNITYENVELSIKNRFHINNIEKHGIKFDEKLAQLCIEEGYYPYDNIIKPDIKILRDECSKYRSLESVKRLISLGIKPDIICLENACKVRNNDAVIKELLSHGLKCNKKCISNQIEANGSRTMKMIMENINPTTFNNENTAENITEIKHIPSPPPKKETPPIPISPKIKTITIPPKKSLNKYTPLTLTSKAKILLDQKSKTTTLINLRKLLLEYIYINNLNSKNNIRINTPLSAILNIDKNNYISFQDIPCVITHLIK